MSNLGRNAKKKKLYNYILRNSVSLDSQGYLDFKGKLKDELNKDNITHEDSLLIVLDIIYSIAENKLDDFEIIPFFFKKRIRIVKEFNSEFDKTDIDLKIKNFFNHEYGFEKKILFKYVSNLESRYNIDTNIRKTNSNFINNIKFQKFEEKEKPIEKENSIVKHEKVFKKTEFKIDLDYLNKDDLCYILDLNPELTFEKAKVLRTQVINYLSNLQLNSDDLKNSSLNDLKRFLAPLIEGEQKKQMEQKKLKKLISKVKSFNEKSYSSILSSNDEYKEIYDEINDNFPEYENKHFNDFKSYKDYVNHVEEYNLINDSISLQKELIDRLNQQFFDIYLNYDQRNNLKSSYNEVYEIYSQIKTLPEVLKKKFLDENCDLKNIMELFNDLDEYTTISESDENNTIRVHNEQFLDKRINKDKEFFKDITDINKKRAIVLDEKNIKVIAGAGTGKTYTIQKKVKYLIEKMGINPKKILCLCYTHKGALELRKKVNKDINADVNAVTFHEFCRRVDRACGGKRRTNKYLLDYIIRKYINNIPLNDEEFHKITKYFCYYSDTKSKIGLDSSIYDELHYLNHHYRTLWSKYHNMGEYVYTREELFIANYLFIHGIDYEFEKYYESNHVNLLSRFSYSGNFLSLSRISAESNHNIIKRFIEIEHSWKSYSSDFYLPEYDLYVDYINCDGLSEENKKKLHDKCSYHEIHNTNQIKLYTDSFNNGTLLDELNKSLIKNDVEIGMIDQNGLLEYFLVRDTFDDYKNFKKLVKTFINIFESKNMVLADFNSFKEKNISEKDIFTRKRQELLLDIILDIYRIYSEHKKSNIFDHNHEITNALDLIESGQYKPSFDYILIDEYQDINHVRCKLLQELQNRTNCKIFVVGDDWQSIYRFNGSDVNLFINFDDYFPNAETIKLEENRRNTQKLIEVSSNFISKNKNQEFKSLSSVKDEIVPNLNPIKIVSYNNRSKSQRKKNKILKLDAIITDILKNNHKKDLKILILGRNNKDINYLTNNGLFKEKRVNKYRKILYSKQKNLDMTFMTIHQAKGLEYDEVILVNFEGDSNFGFPNDFEDDSLLKFVKDYESYPYAEERRLLYVALTRTLNNVYLLAPKLDVSTFIHELRNEFGVEDLYLAVDDEMAASLYDNSDFFSRWEYYETDIPCPNCNGKITIVANNVKQTKYVRCSEHPVPNPSHYNGGPIPKNYSKEDVKYIEKCPSCRGVLIRYGDILKCSLNSEGCMESKELELDEKDWEYDE